MKEKTVKDLKKMMDNNEEFQLIDCREPHEAEIASIGGELIPMGEIMHSLDKLSRDKPLIIHCRSGARSASVTQALEMQHGFKNVYNLKGGILAWSNEIDPDIPKY
jgi:adenylyltransferase/sulfurtransferase